MIYASVYVMTLTSLFTMIVTIFVDSTLTHVETSLYLTSCEIQAGVESVL